MRSKSEKLAQTRVAATCPVSEVEGEDDSPAMAVDDSLLSSSSYHPDTGILESVLALVQNGK